MGWDSENKQSILGKGTCFLVMKVKTAGSGAGGGRSVDLVEYEARALAANGDERGNSELSGQSRRAKIVSMDHGEMKVISSLPEQGCVSTGRDQSWMLHGPHQQDSAQPHSNHNLKP